MKILVAEDDRTSRKSLETTIGKWGYDVVTAADGVEAWDVFQKQGEEFPLIMLDLKMPRISGLEVCRKVRSLSDARLPYIIFLSARESKSIIAEGLLAGADDYITKPFDQTELKAGFTSAKGLCTFSRRLRTM